MINPFEELLVGLSQRFGTPLRPDKRGACTLSKNEQTLQLEYDPSRDRILVASFLGDIPPGKVGENILRDALKANHPFPEIATLGYSQRNNKLTLFSYLPIQGLTADKFAAYLITFIDKAQKWREAMGTGQTAQLLLRK